MDSQRAVSRAPGNVGLPADANNSNAEARNDTLLALLFDENPDGLCILDAQGNLKMNPAANAMVGASDEKLEPGDMEKHGLFREDAITPFPYADLPAMRAMATGESVSDVIVFCRGRGVNGQGLYISASARPLPGGGAVAVFRDVTERKQISDALAQRNTELAEREQENRELIARLRVAVDELSTPVLEIWDDVLALPVVGIVDTQRSAQMTERLLAEVVRARSRSVIIDLTGVELIDTSTADRFMKLARAVQLVGARCLVTGIQPAVAQTLVELGVEFTALETHRNLKSALEACIRRDAATGRAPSQAR
jgi:rsbT co-antagonist protein RsbR